MRNPLISTMRWASLVAALASAGLWARSFFVTDHYVWPVGAVTGRIELVESRALQTTPGRLLFQERTVLM